MDWDFVVACRPFLDCIRMRTSCNNVQVLQSQYTLMTFLAIAVQPTSLVSTNSPPSHFIHLYKFIFLTYGGNENYIVRNFLKITWLHVYADVRIIYAYA